MMARTVKQGNLEKPEILSKLRFSLGGIFYAEDVLP